MGFLFDTSSFRIVTASMDAASFRQKVSSANIANAQTPGYQARQVSFAELLGSSNPFETQLATRMGSSLDSMGNSTGRAVNLQSELIDMQKNMLVYAMATRRASSIFTGLRSAAQIGR